MLLNYILLIAEVFSYLIAFSVLIYINTTTLQKYMYINRIVMHMRFTIKRVLKVSQKTQIQLNGTHLMNRIISIFAFMRKLV